jgi:uncharacterized membrane protein YjjP (DUF1212 family)
LTNLEILIEFKIFLIVELYVIFYGLIQLIKGKWVSALLLVELAIVGVKISQINSIIEII